MEFINVINDFGVHTLKNFRFSSGEVLDEVNVEFLTIGSPKYDKDGKISNAVVYCHGFTGDFMSIKKIQQLAKEGGPFQLGTYFFISISALGSPGSASPSSTQLKQDFPNYDVIDMVNFQRAFLKDKFNISHVEGLIGNSMGGFTVLTWACEYPDEMEFVISMVSSFKTGGQNYIIIRQVNELLEYGIESRNKHSKPLDNRILMLSAGINYAFAFSKKYYMDKSILSLEEDISEIEDESLYEDIFDIYYRNNALLNYDIESDLNKIKAKVLIVAINQDEFFFPETDAIPMSKLIKNSTLLIYDSFLGHVGSNEIVDYGEEISKFLDS